MHEGWYSISDECFYTDTQVTQVTADGQDYHISTETGSKVEWTQEENYKFRLSAFREPLLDHFKRHPNAVYPEQFHAEVVATLSGNLEDLSVSRPRSRLSWGIQVPNDPEHTIYVWIDALTVYLSATGYPWKSDKSVATKAFWPPNLQIIGKDILRYALHEHELKISRVLTNTQVPCYLLPCNASSFGTPADTAIADSLALDR